MRDRIAKAKEMGYTTMANPFKELAKGLSPFGNVGTLPSGTIIGSGYVTDGKGNLFDPLTNKTQSASVIGQLKDLFLKPSDGEEKEPAPPRKTEVTDPRLADFRDDAKAKAKAKAEREKARARAKAKAEATARAEDKLKRATQKREDEKDYTQAAQQKAAEKAFSKTFAEQMAKINQETGPEDEPEATASDQQADARESMTDRGGFEGEIGDYKGAFVGRKYKKNKGMKRGGLASKK